jgi:hypothetical protein
LAYQNYIKVKCLELPHPEQRPGTGRPKGSHNIVLLKREV